MGAWDVEMYFRDQAALDLLQQNTDPATRLSKLSILELSTKLGISYPTGKRMVKRLCNSGYLKKHGATSDVQLEVICLP